MDDNLSDNSLYDDLFDDVIIESANVPVKKEIFDEYPEAMETDLLSLQEKRILESGYNIEAIEKRRETLNEYIGEVH